ncbi:MAG: ATPase P [candidate division Zixibacteria bacterium]|nr:ATPase P [candidate division Zixibacteria bacterium]
MLNIKIPGFGTTQLKHLVCDFSGTLSIDGFLVEGVAERLNQLSRNLDIHILTADTHGRAKQALKGVNCKLQLLGDEKQDIQKEAYIKKLGAKNVIAIGNGVNDRLMLKTAIIGIAICLTEGVAVDSAAAANLLTTSITDALDLLDKPNRLIATLRY